MAIEKSELYSSLWASCDELRGGMDASQYKDYVLVFLFLKYISDKYAGVDFAPITIPAGASFADMAALLPDYDIGEQINRKIIAPLVEANHQFTYADFPDFNDPNKLGSGKEMVDRLTNLIRIFDQQTFADTEKDDTDHFSVGDVYEDLFREFSTRGGKGMGMQLSPLEVNQIMAKVLGISEKQANADTTVYDPTCGFGSLLLQVAKEAQAPISLYGQEQNVTTCGHARMNMALHSSPTVDISQGNALAEPKFLENGNLKQFDYVVACPPFSLRNWSQGVDPRHDCFNQFKFGVPPKNQGDFAFIQHMLASLKPSGRMAVLIPHGPLFRGNAEAAIRQALVETDLVEAVIGLPPNLLAMTGIPTCILVCNKNKSAERANKVLFINANRSFQKNKFKNILLPEHVSKIADTFEAYSDIDQFSKVVSVDEIRDNSFNLNIPRYVDSSELALLLEQYCDKFEKHLLKDIALEINPGVRGRKFTEKANALFVPRVQSISPTTDTKETLTKGSHNYYQVVLNDKAINHYVAQFLRSTIGQHALSALAQNNITQSIDRSALNECIIALPPLEQQKGNVETHKKLSTLRESIERINQDLSLNPTSSTEFEAQLDSMLQAVGKLSQADQIRSIIRQGESKTVEFKETYNLCLRKETKEDYVETAALKTITAFLNSEGGTLLIGVSDAPKIVGIERELKQFHKDNDDKFLLHLKNKLKSRIGEEFYPFINYDLITVDDCKIVHVRCKQSDSPCFLDKNAFYVRTNPASDKIEGQKLIEYVKNRFEH